MNPICFFMYIVVSPAQKEDNFFINTKYQNLIYQWLTSHIANWLHLGAELPFLNNSSHQNYIGPRLSEKNQKSTFPKLFYSHFNLFWLGIPLFVHVCSHVITYTFNSQNQWLRYTYKVAAQTYNVGNSFTNI